MNTTKKLTTFGILWAATISSANAVLIIDFDRKLTGDDPGGSGPFATLTIEDIAANHVKLELTHNSGSAGGQFITRLLLNLTSIPGDIAPVLPLHSKISGSPSFGNDAFNDAGYRFDMDLHFHTSGANGGALRLKPGESATLELTGTGLDALDFETIATGSPERIYGLIHLQGIDGGGSAKLIGDVIPEPTTMLALGAGIAALAARRRKK